MASGPHTSPFRFRFRPRGLPGRAVGRPGARGLTGVVVPGGVPAEEEEGKGRGAGAGSRPRALRLGLALEVREHVAFTAWREGGLMHSRVPGVVGGCSGLRSLEVWEVIMPPWLSTRSLI